LKKLFSKNLFILPIFFFYLRLIATMNFNLFRCCCLPVKMRGRDDAKFLELIHRASTDPHRISKRKRIISQLDRGAELKVLEMDDFTPKGSLGSGTSSDVCLLVRNKDKQKFAGKMFNSDICIREFLKEATIMNKVSKACPTIINLVGIITAPKCLVLEYCVNSSLDNALRDDNENVKRGFKTEFPFLRRLRYILDMCKAVDILHHENICHRDIAMRNLLLSDDKRHVMLADFSLSRVMDSTIETQSTLTSLVPFDSAPETIRIDSTRSYSFKSDIWSMGITMFEIIDWEMEAHIDAQNLPSGFPTESRPSEDVFNRIRDLWSLILRCWYHKPEKRPQSWEVTERIQNLVDNPVITSNENDEYIRRSSHKGFTYGDCRYNDYLIPATSWSESQVQIKTVFENELCLTTRSLCESAISSSFVEQESSDSLLEVPLKEINETQSSNIKGRRIRGLAQGEKRRAMTEHTKGLLECTDNQVFVGYLSAFKAHLRRNSLIPNICPENGYNKSKKFDIIKNKSSQLSPYSYLTVSGGVIFSKRLGSLSSVLSTSVSSLEHVSSVRERMDFCEPLSCSFSRSSVTNIAYCGDRHFFKSPKLFSPERTDTSDYLLTPDLEPVRENVERDEFIANDTPRFHIEVMSS